MKKLAYPAIIMIFIFAFITSVYLIYCCVSALTVYAIPGDYTNWYNAAGTEVNTTDPTSIYYATQNGSKPYPATQYPSQFQGDFTVNNVVVDSTTGRLVRLYYGTDVTHFEYNTDTHIITAVGGRFTVLEIGYNRTSTGNFYNYNTGSMPNVSSYNIGSIERYVEGSSILFTSLNIYDQNGNIINSGYTEFEFDVKNYNVYDDYLNYNRFVAWVYNEYTNENYDGTLKAYIYQGQTLSGLYDEFENVTDNKSLVYEPDFVDEYTSGTGQLYMLNIRDLYDTGTLSYGTMYSLIFTFRSDFNNIRYVISYYNFRIDSQVAGEQQITNDYLQDDAYKEENRHLSDEYDSIKDSFDFIDNQLGSVGDIDEFDGNIDEYLTGDESGLGDVLGAIVSNTLVIKMLILVFTVALVSYVLFGKKV